SNIKAFHVACRYGGGTAAHRPALGVRKLDAIIFKGEINVTISCRRVATPSSVTSDSEFCSSSMAAPHEFFDHPAIA
ncbi:MAG TPA: hypothetical protein VF333_06415, partial [Pyrinomonadaceae bacterium]